MTPPPRLAVVTATHRRPEALERLLSALARQSLPPERFSVCVVNDGSHDARYSRVLEKFPAVVYRVLPRRAGPATARNLGAAVSGGDWLVFTDDDCVPPPDWLERFDPVRSSDAIGGRVELSLGEAAGPVARYLRDISFILPVLAPDGSILCLPTANLAVRREWFERVKGFDARFPGAGGEDMDLTYRLVRAGAKAVVAEGWVTYHESPAGLADLCGRYFRYGRGESTFRLLRGDAGLAPQASYPRRIRALLGLAGKAAGARAAGDLSFRLLTVARQASFEAGRIYGRWRRP